MSYLSTGDNQLHLTLGCADQLAKLGGYALEKAEAVVLGKGVEEVFDGLGASTADVLLKLGNNGRLIFGGKGRGVEDFGELCVPGLEIVQATQGFRSLVERASLCSGSVLNDAGWLATGVGASSVAIDASSQVIMIICRISVDPSSSLRQGTVPEQWHRCRRGRRLRPEA